MAFSKLGWLQPISVDSQLTLSKLSWLWVHTDCWELKMGLLRAPSGSAGWKIGHSCYPIHTPLHWVGGKMSKWLGNIAKVIQSLIGTLESTVLGIEAKIDGWTRSFCHMKRVNFKVPPFFKVGPSNYTCGTSGGNILRFWKKIFFSSKRVRTGMWWYPQMSS